MQTVMPILRHSTGYEHVCIVAQTNCCSRRVMLKKKQTFFVDCVLSTFSAGTGNCIQLPFQSIPETLQSQNGDGKGLPWLMCWSG